MLINKICFVNFRVLYQNSLTKSMLSPHVSWHGEANAVIHSLKAMYAD